MGDDMGEARILLKRRFADFLDRDFEMPGDPNWNYAKGLGDLYSTGDEGKGSKLLSRRLLVNEHHLRQFDETLLLRLLRHPAECLPAFEDALLDFVKAGADATLSKLLGERDELHIGLKGDFGRKELSPRDLSADCLNQLVCLFGIVTKCSLVRPKIVRSAHYCDETKASTTRDYRDVTALTGLPTGAQYPQKDDAGNLLTTEYGLCHYRDNQMIAIQELPETAPPGQLPHSAEVILEDDLVDQVKPGDRVAIVGVYKAMAGKMSGMTSGVFKAVVVGVSVQKLTKESLMKLTVEESQTIRQLADRKDILTLLGNSLAPSIFGHNIIKRGLALLLFGGLEKNLKNGTHLRGDINCLLVGDPGVAKSQMLRAAMNIAPHAVSTTGRGSSGVGLTAAVTTDNETGEKRLEAGAMVLADRGIVCIDEFDKMSDQDRVAIHEVMEQQTVTIAKAGIHTSLNARCSVLAAANPLYGSYDKAISLARNVNLPDSLLSRFDMLFVVLDQMNDQRDREMAMHVIRQHRYRPAGEDGKGAPVQESIHDRQLEFEPDADEGLKVFAKHDVRLHGSLTSGPGGAPLEVLKSDFLRKYIIACRRRYGKEGVKITITDAAAERVVDYYQELRANGQDRALPVTARTLETIIRLATAMCKVRYKFQIEESDVDVATDILDHVMRKDVGCDDEPEDNGEEAEEDYLEEPDRPAQPPRKKASRKRTETGDGEAPADDAEASAEESSRRSKRRATEASVRQAAGPMMQAMGLPSSSSAPQEQRIDAGGVLSDKQRAVVVEVIGECLTELQDDFIPLDELQARLRDRKLVIADSVLAEFLTFCQENYDSKEWRTKLPPIVYDKDEKNFVGV